MFVINILFKIIGARCQSSYLQTLHSEGLTIGSQVQGQPRMKKQGVGGGDVCVHLNAYSDRDSSLLLLLATADHSAKKLLLVLRRKPVLSCRMVENPRPLIFEHSQSCLPKHSFFLSLS